MMLGIIYYLPHVNTNSAPVTVDCQLKENNRFRQSIP